MLPSWDNIKHFVLLRRLVDDGRAQSINVNKKIKNDSSDLDDHKVIQKLLTGVIQDVFREVLKFLI